MLDYFTTAYFHRPDELRAEMSGAGFIVDVLYGLEGPGWLLPDVTARLLKVARLLESEASCSASVRTCWGWLEHHPENGTRQGMITKSRFNT